MRCLEHKMSAAAALGPLSTHHPSPVDFTPTVLSLHRLLPGLLWRAPHLSFPFYSCCFQCIVSITANVIFSKHPSGHVTFLFTGLLLVLPGRPKPLMRSEGPQGLASACPSSLVSWQSPLGLCDPSMPAFHFHQHFHIPLPHHRALAPVIPSAWSVLPPPSLFFCLGNSYSCFRCQFKCYVLREAFKPTYSLFVLMIWFVFLQNTYVSL